MGEFFRRIYYLLNRRKLERELQNDIDFHREMLSAEGRKDFGNAILMRERAREAWGWGWLDRLMQDLHFGVRLLKKSPGLAFTAIMVLALGIGVNVTAFNIIDVFYFRPLPVRDPSSLVRFTTEFPEGSTTEVAYPTAKFYAEHTQSLSTMLALRWTNLTYGEETSKSIRAGVVSVNYFSELGSAAAYGRLFLPQSDGVSDAPPVVVLGYGFWQRNFGGNASVVGRTIQLNQHVATIIGITAFDFAGLDPEDGERNDVWLLIHQEPYFVPASKVLASFDDRESNIHMWGRLKPGVTMRQAQQALLPLAEELVHQHPDVMHQGEHLRAYPGAYAAQANDFDLPLLALADVLGVPEQDRWLLFDWSNRVIGYQDPDYASSAEFDPAAGTAMAREALAERPAPGPGGRMPDPRTREGMPDLYAYAHLLAEEKRRRPGDDVMSILLGQSDEGGARVSVAEFENMFWLFAVAGNETLRNGLPGACIALLEHPRAQDELRADPGLLPVAADEMLRWWTPVMTFRRTAAEDCQIGSQPVRSGEKVVVSFTSANRDEAVFADPGRFDIRRQPNPHLAFGHGPHFCLGAHLARTQMRALFAEVLARTSRLEAAGPPSYLRSNFQRGVKRLPLAWTA
jgi:cytochrome P450